MLPPKIFNNPNERSPDIEECPSCGGKSAYAWEDVSPELVEGDSYLRPSPSQRNLIAHIGAASGFEWECGHCGASWTPSDSPLTSEVYTHRDPNANSKDEWEVSVGNIGNISCKNKSEALKTFDEYVRQSKTGRGRAGGESVVIFKNGEIVKEYDGSNENPLEKKELGNPHCNPRGVYDRFKPGDRVKVSGGSGLDSDRVGTIIPWSQYVGPVPRSDVRRDSEAVLYDDASPASEPYPNRTGYMYRSRLIKGDFPVTLKYEGMKPGWWKNPSNRNLAADFAAGATSGKAFGSIFIEGNTIYSYGKHWPIATRHPSQRIAYINANRYSVTTSKQTGAVAGALAISGYTTIPSDRTENFEVIAPSSEFVEAGQRAKAVEAVKSQKRMRAKTDKLGMMAGLKPGQLPNPKINIASIIFDEMRHRVGKDWSPDPVTLALMDSYRKGFKSVDDEKEWVEDVYADIPEIRKIISKRVKVLNQQSFLSRQYGKHLEKKHENPGMTLIGRKCLEITMTGGRCEGNFGAAYGMKDGSAFIKGVFTKVPGGRVKAILYLDEAKAKREGLTPANRPWKHDFSSLDAKAVRVKGGLVIKSKTPLWENR